MTADTSQVNFADPWNRETQRLIRTIFKARFAFGLLAAFIFCVFAIWDRTPWKLVWIALTGIAVLALSLVEYLRLQRSPAGPATIQLNLAGVLLVQTAMIYVTGGIESPLMMVYVPLGLITGLSLGSLRRVAPVLGVPMLFSFLFAVGSLGGWLPRATPEFFGLGAGFAKLPVYVLTKASVTAALVMGTSFAGIAVRRVYEKIVHQVVDARREALETLTSRNRELLSVSSTVAHELKNPLSSIQGLAQLLLRSAPPGKKDHERLDVMLREIGRMRTVLDEFRDLTRPLSGLSLQRVPLLDLVRDLVRLSEGTAESRRISLEAPKENPVIRCDPRKLKQALLNLVFNGIEATPKDGRIELEVAQATEGRVRITVRDFGTGLDPEVAKRPFTPGLTTKEGGSGIGLVVARSIAEQHGGSLELVNADGGGSIATLTLPLEAPLSEEDL
jgi:two-component system, NtrC family, sensor histidine kinase HydH